MKRGDIYFANLDPTVGSEIKKHRPVLIVSNDANNAMASTVTVVPLTSNIKKVYPFELLAKKENTGLSKDSKAQCHQVRTISKLRFNDNKTGELVVELMSEIDTRLAEHLGLL